MKKVRELEEDTSSDESANEKSGQKLLAKNKANALNDSISIRQESSSEDEDGVKKEKFSGLNEAEKGAPILDSKGNVIGYEKKKKSKRDKSKGKRKSKKKK